MSNYLKSLAKAVLTVSYPASPLDSGSFIAESPTFQWGFLGSLGGGALLLGVIFAFPGRLTMPPGSEIVPLFADEVGADGARSREDRKGLGEIALVTLLCCCCCYSCLTQALFGV